MRWNQKEGSVKIEMTSSIDQKINLRIPGSKQINSLKVIEGKVIVESSAKGTNTREITLPAGSKVRIEILFDPERHTL